MRSIALLQAFVVAAGFSLPSVGFSADAASAKNGNPYAAAYEQRREAPAATGANVRIYRGSDQDADGQRLMEDGYDLLGSSSFVGGEVPPDQAVAHAKNIRADLVMVYSTRFGKIPHEAKLDAAKAKAKGPAEPAVAEGVAGDAPKMQLIGGMEYSYEYYASFWTKLPTPLLGLHVQDRAADDKSPGVPVIAVIKESPAAVADIRKGDVVLRVAGVDIGNGDALINAVRSNAGKTVEIDYARGGVQLQKKVTLNTP